MLRGVLRKTYLSIPTFTGILFPILWYFKPGCSFEYVLNFQMLVFLWDRFVEVELLG